MEMIREYLLALQNKACEALKTFEPKARFLEDSWTHAQGGGGISRLLQNGLIFEKAGVNFSHISGHALPESATLRHPELAGKPFQALGISIVCHPNNPYVPTSHANVRFIQVGETMEKNTWWFGGGYDLTPCYGFTYDCVQWHRIAKKACDPYGSDVYPKFKAWCDDYFYLKHREEPRGIGGIFFDDLNEWGFEKSFAFWKGVVASYLEAYLPIVKRRKGIAYGHREKTFQRIRRGRYVEFNLLYDRGTLFGLQSGGRTGSILMSLPPQVNWEEQWQPAPGSLEAQLHTDFLVPKAWV